MIFLEIIGVLTLFFLVIASATCIIYYVTELSIYIIDNTFIDNLPEPIQLGCFVGINFVFLIILVTLIFFLIMHLLH